MKKEELELLSNKDIAYMIVEESKKKLSIAHKGKKLSDEAKLKCSLNGIKGKHRVWNEDHTKYHYE